ncbi:RHS repeat-associated core domain-containing protein [Parvularcula sp. LCG005]|uniref:RHS repeat domain-containing protein n=1 Tax=Parvularcula sp. LCG005 TaxID=3078805 RepID=UPI002943EA54|nr:RHS repeat-associated core domain-containing protein [Parvularcula sp. LCG005]WOI53037.1 RHS repeat-associated core domain-containing protein [Parvularcula sp. LCG005]
MRKFSLAAVSALVFCIGPFAHAQYTAINNAPERPSVTDENGINLASGSFSASFTLATIGDPDGDGGLAFTRSLTDQSWRTNFDSAVYYRDGFTVVSIGGGTVEFKTINGVGFVPRYASPAKLVLQGTDYVYTSADGTVVFFERDYGIQGPGSGSLLAKATTLTKPDGEVLTYTYKQVQYDVPIYTANNPNYTMVTASYHKLMNVESSLGWQYRAFDGNALIDTTVETCSVAAENCSAATDGSWPQAAVTDTTVRDATNKLTNFAFTRSGNRLTKLEVTYPAGHKTTINYDSSERVTSVVRGGSTWTYSYSTSGTTQTTTVYSPSGRTRIVSYDTSKAQVIDDELRESPTIPGLKKQYQYFTSGANEGMLQHIIYPDTKQVTYAYDDLGRVIQTRVKPNAGSSLKHFLTTAGYPSSSTCTSTGNKRCLQPDWTKDNREQQTDYTYSNSTGAPLTVTMPAANGGTRPRAVYNYASYSTKPGTQISRLTSVTQCTTAQTCAGSVNEAVSEIVYSTDHHRRALEKKQRTGSNSVLLTTVLTYNPHGRVKTINGPGSNDTVTATYDDAGRPLLQWSALSSTKYDYDSAGRLTHLRKGYGNFTELLHTRTVYNAQGRAYAQIVFNGGTPQSKTVVSFDSEGRIVCTAVRANPSSSNGDACSNDGSDRITKQFYDGYGRVDQVNSGVGTSTSISEYTSYTTSGRRKTVQDANGNLTTYEYDHHDRLIKTRYPNKTSSGSSTSDYEQYTYDDAGTWATQAVKTHRRRDGTVLTYNYDNIGQLTGVDAPGTADDLSFGYDLVGRKVSSSKSGQSLSFGYNALGWPTSSTSPLGTVSYLYNSKGQRDRLTWPDASYVTYAYDGNDRLYKIRESGSTDLVTYSYDAFGRRSRSTFGNGVYTDYRFDDASRLDELDLTFPAATSYNQQVDFSFNAFSQITSKSQTNSGYYDALGAVSETYTANGLNQLLKTGGTQMTYDGRGNMTNDGGTAYTYDVYNHLKTANNGAGTYTYDPEGRLYREQGAPIGGGTAIDSRFLYDGADIIAEYNSSGTITARYVHGPGVDEPIVWYNGAGMSSSTRRYMSADERGSIIMVTNNSGGYVARNKYDDYGDPSSTNTTRFQYTGQIYLKTAGLYHYKARAYHPGIGRFMQTDPIGYGDGLNMYAYVGGDPVNGNDPSGLLEEDVITVYGSCGRGGCGYNGFYDDEFEAYKILTERQLFASVVPIHTMTGGEMAKLMGEILKEALSQKECSDTVSDVANFLNDLGNAADYVGLGVAGGAMNKGVRKPLLRVSPIFALASFDLKGSAAILHHWNGSKSFASADAAIAVPGQIMTFGAMAIDTKVPGDFDKAAFGFVTSLNSQAASGLVSMATDNHEGSCE